jgi:type I restriction enzyme, S subunit
MPFLKHLIGSRPFQDQLDAAKSGVSIEHFGPTHLNRILICLPCRSEQDAIVQHISEATAQFHNAGTSVDREVAVLQEFRTRLIADVVTGKLDVRAAAANLAEVTELEAIDQPADGEDLDEAIDDGENEEVAAA